MISADGGRKMPCEGCGVQFSVFRRKRACSECDRLYCAACLRRGGGLCMPCRTLCSRPLLRAAIASLKVRDLQCFLHRQNVSTRGCVEKEELISLCITHVNGPGYRRRGTAGSGAAGGARGANGAFSTLKGLTTDINNFLSSTFDIRLPTSPQPQANNRYHCYNSAHAHAAPQPAPHPAQQPPSQPPPPRHERFTTTPGGERDIRVPPPPSGEGEGVGEGGSTPGSQERRDTADCFEVEDLDEWELLSPPTEPLPGDSEVLLTANEQRSSPPPSPHVIPPSPRVPIPTPLRPSPAPLRLSPGPSTPLRASSELELNRSESGNTADTTSLQDEPTMGYDTESAEFPQQITLESICEEAGLEALSVRQLKQLLARNRVEFRGCLERADLLARARTLYREHVKYKDAVDALPIEECCKICMAAPLECVLLECGHIAACTACSKQLAECPICRQFVVRAVRCFRS